jgi:hypothetical protein
MVPEQFGGRAAAVAFGVAAGEHAHVVVQAVPSHGGPVALPSLDRDGLSAAVDVDDFAVTEPGQVRYDECLAAVISGPHHVDVA